MRHQVSKWDTDELVVVWKEHVISIIHHDSFHANADDSTAKPCRNSIAKEMQEIHELSCSQ